ncbi:MAG: AbrB/MazE/SpoVT family DNA-binding domain-containing protein [Planctomycetes bacterium]|nr:AbrB/MazE/SpoVT family DNA-binding domain-containing protein [Planctomycetota bacterium]
MDTRIKKWGNSLAVRIPKPLAAEIGLEQDSAVEVSLEKGRLVITPERRPAPTLNDLLAKVTKDNLHGEIDTGPAVGKEEW